MADQDDLTVLTALNASYIDSVVRADAARFNGILAGDFLCSNPDGSLLDKQQFLQQVRAASPLGGMDIDDVRIRLMGDVAIIHGRTNYTLADGRKGSGRYTDVWARRNGQWLAVSAHVTRLV